MYAGLDIPGPQEHTYVINHNPTVDNKIITGSDSIWQWIDDTAEKSPTILQIPKSSDYNSSLWYILAIIQIAVNWILGILAFIALIYLLYCWFLVLSSWSNDKNASKWTSWIKTTVIAIVWIGLAWLVISAMIWLINYVTVTVE